MAAYVLLFGVEVAHAYFARPGSCRLTFEPDDATAAWLHRAGCVTRATPNTLSIFLPSGPSSGPAALPVALAFSVRAQDPLFGLYTDGLPPRAGAAPGQRPALVFDSAQAAPDAAGATWRATLATDILMAPLSDRPASGSDPASGPFDVRPQVDLIMRLSGDPAERGRRYALTLDSRRAAWKYLLSGKSAGEAVLEDAAPDADGAASFTRLDPDVALADGRSAVAFRSDAPLALRDRPARRFRLRSAVDERVLINSLPAADVQNLALDSPGDPSSLVCEIFVSC